MSNEMTATKTPASIYTQGENPKLIYQSTSGAPTIRHAVTEALRLGRSFFDAELSNVDLSDLPVNVLGNADFSHANLRNAKFTRSTMTGANFTRANLFGACFYSSVLESVSFERADLVDADLQSAYMNRTVFTNANGVVCLPVHDPRGYRAIAVWSLKNGCWMIKSGCRWYTLSSAREHWSKCSYTKNDDIAKAYRFALDCLAFVPEVQKDQ